MSGILDGLNEQQLIAVRDTIHQSALVLAGAGSGKTRVLTHRIAYLLEQGISPHSIMAITFTNKAAREMQERIANLIGEENAKKLTMGTFHKICIQMLKRYGDRIGLDKGFTIADPSDQTQTMRQALAMHNLDTSAQEIRNYLSQVSKLKNKGWTPEQYHREGMQGYYPQQELTLYHVYRDYQGLLKKYNMLDFDDLLMYAVKLLQQSKEVREYYQKRFAYIMVDEYQDTNPCQYQLIRLIAGKEQPEKETPNNVFVVGDDAQSIYAFRGSDISIILRFEQDFPEAKVIKLEENYRSTKAIVHVGNGLIKHNQCQKQKTLYTKNENGEKVKVYEGFRSEDEVKFVVQEIQNLVAFAGYDYKDIAVLYRTNFLSREIETQLVNQRIPYRIIGGVGFYDRMEIKDTIAYLKVIANPKDDIAMERILSITPGIGKSTIQTMKQNAEIMNMPLSEVFKQFHPSRKSIQDAFDSLRQLLQELYLIYQVNKTEKRSDPVTKMMEIVWKRTGYKEKLKEKNSKENLSRLQNLHELFQVAKTYENTVENPTLEDFLDSITLQVNEEQDIGNSVSLMTIHASKGLEFPVVFVIGMNEEIFPHKNSLLDEGGLEEERRLAYVAITRAKKLLYLTYCKLRGAFNSNEWMAASRFIEELPQEAVQYLA